MEERFVLSEITKEQYDKFSSKYRDELSQLRKEIKAIAEMSSNLEKAVEKGLNISENISQLWISADYYEKQKLQYMLFPEGLLYDKKMTEFEPIESIHCSAKSQQNQGL